MALKVWLPLNEDTRNLGLSVTRLISGTPAFIDNGKMGKALGNSESSPIWETINSEDVVGTIGKTKKYSICYWYKLLDSTKANRWIVFLGTGTGTARGVFGGNGTSPTYLHWAYSGTGTNIPISVNTNDGSWHHVCVTVNGTQVTLYIDGVTQGTATDVGSQLAGNRIGINQSGNAVCDFRLYNHVLSKKEVKEIAKGLALHYKLDGNECGGNPNLIENATTAPSGFYDYPGIVTTERLASDGATATKIFALTFPATSETYSNTNTYVSFTRDESAVKQDGKTYTLSFKVKSSKALSSYTFLYEYTSSTATVDVGTEWKTVKLTGVANGAYSALYVCYGSGRPKINGGTLYIADLKLELGDKVTPWCPHSLEASYKTLGYGSTRVSDCSGLGNHGTSSNVSISNNSIRYNSSLSFNGSSSYVKTNALAKNIQSKEAMTAAFWAYQTSWSTWTRPVSCTEGGGWNFEPNNSKIAFTVGTGESSNTYKYVVSTNTYSTLTTGWHHFVGTYDGFSSKLYIDGVLNNTATHYTTKTPMYFGNVSIFVGAEAATNAASPYFNGLISDFRLYSTALSDNDIKTLYKNSGAMIDTEENLFAYELVNQSLAVGDNGIVKTNNFSESANNFISSNGTNHIVPAGKMTTLSFTPAANTDNLGTPHFSTLFLPCGPGTYRVEMDVEWTTFAAGTGGTFRAFFQGKQIKNDNTSIWGGTSYINTALNNQQILTNLINANATGFYHYDTTFTIPSEWFDTYYGSTTQIRIDYSDGNGTIKIKNFRVYPEKVMFSSDGNIGANSFYEY